MAQRPHFHQTFKAYALMAPQLLVTMIFFVWPALSALRQAFFRGDAFGLHHYFVWWDNFSDLFRDPTYMEAFKTTLVFSAIVTVLVMCSSLVVALALQRVVRGRKCYKTLLILPYAVAPAVAGMLWRFLFDPAIGIVSTFLEHMGYTWNYLLHAKQALGLVIISAAWQQFSYNLLFFFAGLQAIPRSLLEAAALDGAGPWQRFHSIILPLLSPTTFFLLVINVIYAFFDTFGIIQVVTRGGPDNATNILVHKVYNDGFVGLDLGGSAAQSVLLMSIVIGLTVLQFRYIERKVHY